MDFKLTESLLPVGMGHDIALFFHRVVDLNGGQLISTYDPIKCER